MIDIMGDLYDPSPLEITRHPDAIDRQRRLIDRIHALGAEVVMSSHLSCLPTTEQVAEHLRALRARGPDVVKIVTGGGDTEGERTEAPRTTLVQKREVGMPFIHFRNGRFSRTHRCFGPALGLSIAFAVYRCEPRYGMTPPTIRAMRAVLDNLLWKNSG